MRGQALGLVLGWWLAFSFGFWVRADVFSVPLQEVIVQGAVLEDMAQIIAGYGFGVPGVDGVGLDIELDDEAVDHEL
jgi:hypothetical protein